MVATWHGRPAGESRARCACHNLACGDLSPLSPLQDQSADKSAHSKIGHDRKMRVPPVQDRVIY